MSLRDHRQKRSSGNGRKSNNRAYDADLIDFKLYEEGREGRNSIGVLKHFNRVCLSKEISELARESKIPPAKKIEMIFALVDDPNACTDIVLSQALHRIAVTKEFNPHVSIANSDINKILKLWARCTRFERPGIREFSNILWATAKLSCYNQQLVDSMHDFVVDNIEKFNSQDVANTAWSFAVFGIKDDEVFKALGKKFQELNSEFDSQDVSNIVWSFAKLGMVHEDLFKVLSERSQEFISEFNSQQISNTAWAFATLGIKDEVLFKTLSERTKNIIGNFDAINISTVCWAYAKLQIRDEKFFSVLSQRARKIIAEFLPQNLSNTIWSFVKLGINDGELFDSIATRANDIISELDYRSATTIFWSLCFYDEKKVRGLMAMHKLRNPEISLGDTQEDILINLKQTHIAEVICGTRRSGDYHPIIANNLDFFDKGRVQNSFEIEVQRVLQRIKDRFQHLEISNNQIVDTVEVDFIVKNDSKRFIIECDGEEYHRYEDGAVVAKDIRQDKLFRKAGYAVIHILNTDWNTLTEDEKASFFVGMLELE